MKKNIDIYIIFILILFSISSISFSSYSGISGFKSMKDILSNTRTCFPLPYSSTFERYILLNIVNVFLCLFKYSLLGFVLGYLFGKSLKRIKWIGFSISYFSIIIIKLFVVGFTRIGDVFSCELSHSLSTWYFSIYTIGTFILQILVYHFIYNFFSDKSLNYELEENKHEYPLFISTFLNVKLFHFSWLFIPMSVYISFLLRFSFGALLGPIWKTLFLAFSEQSMYQGMQLLIYLLFIFSPFIALFFLFKALSVKSTYSYNTNNILIISLGIILPIATYFVF